MIIKLKKMSKKIIIYKKRNFMQVESILVEIPNNNNNPTTEYIESELTKLNINPLRWAVVHVSDKIYTVSVANLKE